MGDPSGVWSMLRSQAFTQQAPAFIERGIQRDR